MGLDARPSDVQEAEGGLYEIDTLATGNQAPRFEARTIDSELVRLVNLEGRVVCLDFWETTCGPCWREFSTLRTVNASFPVSDCQLVGISSDQDEAKLRSVIASEQLAWPQIREEVGWDGRRAVFGPLRTLFNVWGVPRTILIDRQGHIIAKDLRGEHLIDAVRKQVAG